jgi:hypothetical protein
MNLLSRLIMLLTFLLALAAPASAAVAVDPDGYCDVAAADGKKDGDKQDGEEEPECD